MGRCGFQDPGDGYSSLSVAQPKEDTWEVLGPFCCRIQEMLDLNVCQEGRQLRVVRDTAPATSPATTTIS